MTILLKFWSILFNFELHAALHRTHSFNKLISTTRVIYSFQDDQQLKSRVNRLVPSEAGKKIQTASDLGRKGVSYWSNPFKKELQYTICICFYQQVMVFFPVGYRRHRLSAEHHGSRQRTHQETVSGQRSRTPGLPEGRNPGHSKAQVVRRFQLGGATVKELAGMTIMKSKSGQFAFTW